MIQIHIFKDLFEKYQGLFTDPVTNKPIVIELPSDTDQHPQFKEELTRKIIVEVVISLRRRQDENINYHLKYKELSSKQRGLINAIRQNLAKFNQSDNYKSLADFQQFIYENIFPYLAMFKPSTAIYDRLLQFIEDQCNTELEILNEREQNPEFVKS